MDRVREGTWGHRSVGCVRLRRAESGATVDAVRSTAGGYRARAGAAARASGGEHRGGRARGRGLTRDPEVARRIQRVGKTSLIDIAYDLTCGIANAVVRISHG